MSPSKNRSLLIAALTAAAAFIRVYAVRLPDLAYSSLKIGEGMVSGRVFSAPDYISYLPLRPGWWDTAWLWRYISYGLYCAGGESALKVFAGVMAAFLAAILYKVSSGEKRLNYGAALISIIDIILLDNSLSFKPIAAGCMLFALQMYIIERPSIKPVALLFLYLAWSQIDHSFMAGLAYLVFHTAFRSIPRRKKALLIFASVAGAMISRNAVGIILHPGVYASFLDSTPNFHQLTYAIEALAVFSGLAGAAILKERTGRVAGLTAITAVGLIAGDYFPFAVIAAAPIIVDGAAVLIGEMKLSFPRPAKALIIFAAFSVALLSGRAVKPGDINEDELAGFLKSHPFFGQILAPWQISGRAAWITGKKISLDGRRGPFDRETAVIQAGLYDPGDPGWEELTRKYDIGAVVVEEDDGGAYSALARRYNWTLIYRNARYAFFIRDEGMNIALAEKWGRIDPRSMYNIKVEDLFEGDKYADAENRARKWMKKGNPYRARQLWKEFLLANPENIEAQKALNQIESVIAEAARGR